VEDAIQDKTHQQGADHQCSEQEGVENPVAQMERPRQLFNHAVISKGEGQGSRYSVLPWSGNRLSSVSSGHPRI
jgi:hypothetical protein